MSGDASYFRFRFLDDCKILSGEILVDDVDKDGATAIYDYLAKELPAQPDSIGFILNILKVASVSSYALGVLMKSLALFKKTKNYLVLLMTESLLQEIMLAHPEMFDYYAVFHRMDDAVKFISEGAAGN